MEILRESFGIEIRVIKAGRPMANGQAESAVKNLKSKMKLLSMENGNNFKKKILLLLCFFLSLLGLY
jgi:hypothetical protein|tara:strand:+ start:241 stop:441 length:201 start_codon:yes stop_codon:yes gene_type:complete